MKETHPAMVAARNSWRCVQGKLKDEWLGLMSEDVVIEDPIGRSPLDPEGRGHRGKAAASAFWDRNIGPSSIQIEPHKSFTCGSEAAHLLTLTTKLSTGQTLQVHGIFTYRVDDAGLLVSLRGFWDMTDMNRWLDLAIERAPLARAVAHRRLSSDVDVATTGQEQASASGTSASIPSAPPILPPHVRARP